MVIAADRATHLVLRSVCAGGPVILIARDPACGLWLDDPKVSRHHARVRLESGAWLIEDLGSRNGTLVDGRPVEQIALPHRADVRLCPLGPLLRLEQEAAGATTVRAVLSGEQPRMSEERW